MNIIERLETLRKLNRDPQWVNDSIFKLVCAPDMAVLAYEHIKSRAGNLTAGTDKLTLDEISYPALEAICDAIKSGSYTPKPVRRKYIPKPNGKLRPLGIPSPRDKIVQEMIREILESIYDGAESPAFSNQSHGFRANRSCHTAIEDFKTWQGVKWIIEGDINTFFDSVDHHILIKLLRKKIKDERFINLIWKFLRTGIQDENGVISTNKSGIPQGGVSSPILANIYLHEFDQWVNHLQEELNKGKKRKANPAWRKLTSRRKYLLDNKLASWESEEIKKLEQLASSIPSVLVDDPEFCRVYYTRYADDWIIGIVGSMELAETVKNQATLFLEEELNLSLSREKTLISHAKDITTEFLGFNLGVGSSVRRRTVKAEGRRTATKRTTGWQPRVDVRVKSLIERLQEAGYCHALKNKPFFPCSKKSFVALEDHEIIMRYNSVWRGIYNYYCICDNAHRLSWVMYILQYSCLMTLSHKHNRSVPKTIQKVGVFPKVTYMLANGQIREVSFWRPTEWKSQPPTPGKSEDLDIILAKSYRLTRTHLHSPCTICAKPNGVEMHHVRALRRGTKKTGTPFNQIMSAINRKQIPLCRDCHNSVHAGKYDGKKLSDLAYIPQ